MITFRACFDLARLKIYFSVNPSVYPTDGSDVLLNWHTNHDAERRYPLIHVRMNFTNNASFLPTDGADVLLQRRVCAGPALFLPVGARDGGQERGLM